MKKSKSIYENSNNSEEDENYSELSSTGMVE